MPTLDYRPRPILHKSSPKECSQMAFLSEWTPTIVKSGSFTWKHWSAEYSGEVLYLLMGISTTTVESVCVCVFLFSSLASPPTRTSERLEQVRTRPTADICIDIKIIYTYHVYMTDDQFQVKQWQSRGSRQQVMRSSDRRSLSLRAWCLRFHPACRLHLSAARQQQNRVNNE